MALLHSPISCNVRLRLIDVTGDRTSGDWARGIMDRFIACENIKRFKQQLDACTDETQRCTLERLLADEEAKLKSMTLSMPRPT